MLQNNRNWLCILLSALLLFPSLSLAQTAGDAGMLTDITQQFLDTAQTWAGQMQDYAAFLFWSLGAISLVWLGIQQVFKGADFAGIIGEFLRFMIFFGFMYWLLLNGPQISMAIIKSFMQMGTTLGGDNLTGSPSGILELGFRAFQKVYDSTSVWSPMQSAIMILVALAVLAIISLIAVNLAILLISTWIVVYGGIFILGFGGSKWTSDLAINYFKNVMSLGFQLLGMMLIVSIGQIFLNDMINTYASGELTLDKIGNIVVASLILFVLSSKIPAMLGALATGGSIGNASNGGMAMGAAAAGMAVAAGTMAMAATKIAGAVAGNALGGKDMLSAAFSKAEAALTGGGGGANDTTPDITGLGGGGGGGGDGGGQSGIGSFSQGSASPASQGGGDSEQDADAGASSQGNDQDQDQAGTGLASDPASQGNTGINGGAGAAPGGASPDDSGPPASPNNANPGAGSIKPNALNKTAYAAGTIVGTAGSAALDSLGNATKNLAANSTLGKLAARIESGSASNFGASSKTPGFKKPVATKIQELNLFVNKSMEW